VIELWAKEKLDWLRGCLQLEHGIPSHDTFGRIFGLIDAEQFGVAFQKANAGSGRIVGHSESVR
jgi:DDE_Tnp_1-associated